MKLKLYIAIVFTLFSSLSFPQEVETCAHPEPIVIFHPFYRDGIFDSDKSVALELAYDIDEEGKFINFQVLSMSTDEVSREPILAAAKKWKGRPNQKNCKWTHEFQY